MTADHSQRSWESRLSSAPDGATAAFVQSLDIDTRLAPHDIAGSVAHAQMLSEVGLITAAEFQAIAEGLQAIGGEIASGRFVFETAHEDIHMAIEAALIARIGEPGRKLHTARSRNDQVATDLRLWCRSAVDRLDNLLRDLQRTLVAAAARDATLVMPGVTHLQHAQPVSAGQYYLAYVEQFDRDRQRLADARRRINRLPLGAAALAGTSLPIHRQRVCELLGFEGLALNSMDASCDRDFAAEYIFATALLAVHLSRWAEDWIVFASSEFAWVEIADAYCTSSSMMPQKKNPDTCELIRGRSAGVLGSLMAMMALLKAQPMGYNRDLQEDKRHVFAAADLIEPSVAMATRVLAHSRLRPERLSAATATGHLDATALAEYLVERGVAFRTAHGVVGSLVRLCESRGLSQLSQLPLADLQAVCPAVDANVTACLGAANVVGRYRSAGSAGVASVESQIRDWQTRLA